MKTWSDDMDDFKGKRCSAVPEFEAQEIHVKDQLNNLIEQSKVMLECRLEQLLLSIERFVGLYRRNLTPNGHHFVVHQYDHPIAGLHYDLHHQISESSSSSFAIMYRLLGNPNSRRLYRNSTEQGCLICGCVFGMLKSVDC